MSEVNTSKTVPVQQCTDIPVLTPGYVQAMGALIMVDKNTHKVLQISANCADFLASADETWLGRDARECFPQLYGQISEQLTDNNTNQSGNLIDHGSEVHFLLAADSLFIEFISAAAVQQQGESALGSAFHQLAGTTDLDSLHHSALQALHGLIGYDHIMVYRFDEQWNGEVIAEWINPEQAQHYTAYLNLHFPERDIPEQARDLYTKHWVRYTADVHSTPVPLKGLPNLTAGQANIGPAYVRGIAPSHVQYLKNMGVTATYSASIMVDGKLWGLLAAHHHTAKPISFAVLDASEEFAMLYSALLSAKQQDALVQGLQRHKPLLATFANASAKGRDPLRMTAEQLAELARAFDAHGVVVWDQTPLQHWGVEVDAPWCESVLKHLAEQQAQQQNNASNVIATHCVSARLPELKHPQVAGVLVIGGPLISGRALMMLRKEEAQEKRWGGDPSASAMTVRDGMLNPRNSFDVWKETLSGFSRPWRPSELALAETLADQFTNAFVALGTLDSAQKSAKLNMLNMLLHDIGNALSGVSGEVLQLQQAVMDKTAMDNLERLVGFIKTHLGAISDAMGEQKGVALYELIGEIQSTLANQFIAVDDAIGHMERGVIHARELLDIQKAYAQTSTQYGRKCHLAEIINDAAGVLRNSIENRGAYYLTMEDDVPALTVDRSKIMQVMMNLIKNAYEAWDARQDIMNEQSDDQEPLLIHIEVSVTSDNVVLTLQDNGIGIEPEQLPQVFSDQYSTKQRSSGVGLFSCKKLAESCGAQLSLQSEGKLQGAIATLVFPKELWA